MSEPNKSSQPATVPSQGFTGGLMQQPTQPRHVLGAGVASGICIAATLWVLPHSSRLLSPRAWFLPVTVSLACFAEMLTAVLLLLQFRRTGRISILLVSAAYVAAACGMAAQLLVYPGVFSETGLYGATATAAPWMWLVWHFAFAGCIFAATLLIPVPAIRESRRGLTMAAGLVLPAALTSLFMWISVQFGDRLALALASADPARPTHAQPGIAIWVLGWIALIMLWAKTKFRSKLQLWAGAALLTYLCETLLMVMSMERFTVGWYFSRTIILVAALLLLSALLFEIDDLYSSADAANKVLHERSIRDSLTGVFLRRYLTEQLTTELGRARRKNEPVSLLMFDVDWFKKYNDKFGHQAGDDCLVEVCRTTERHLRRHGDFLARYGGEEFAVVLPNTRQSDAETIANRIRASVAEMRFAVGGGLPVNSVTVSIGVATAEHDADMDERSLIRAADRALYLAKNAGRNRVVVDGREAGVRSL